MVEGQTTLLVVAAIIAPVIWGLAASWVMERLWPSTTKIAESPPAPEAAAPHDYQV